MISPLPPISEADREHILKHTTDPWHDLARTRLFITGGTGFFGKWLLESIAAANDRLGTQVRATILSRNPARFGEEVPHLATRPEFDWLIGDAASFMFPAGKFDYVFHFATASAAEVGAGDTATIMRNLQGIERVLDFARAAGVKHLLYASSGAVYGPQPTGMERIPESYRGAPDTTNPAAGYGEMKRMEEHICSRSGVDCVIARGFSFLGPYLPLTDKFAAGSFIRDALSGGPIRIRGGGRVVRSYLYAADLAVWLPTLLARGQGGSVYNLGSDEEIALSQLAKDLAAMTRTGINEIAGERQERYVPAVDKAYREIGLRPLIPLSEALARTLSWAWQKSARSTSL